MSTSPAAPAAVEAADPAHKPQPAAVPKSPRPRRAPNKRPAKAAKPALPVKMTKAAIAAPAPKAPATGKHPAAPKPASPAKQVAATKPMPAAKTSTVEKPRKAKAKLVRDSFTMPQADFDLIATLKQRALAFQRPAKKSELLRAGLYSLQALSDGALRAALDALTPLNPGRPKKSD